VTSAPARRENASYRAANFSAGPAGLPTAVLERVQADLTDYRGLGLSVMEMSHRSPEFIEIAAQAESDLRSMLAVPDDYAVLFLQGGATHQFAMLPWNLSDPGDTIAYAQTGHWSVKAVAEARRLRDVVLVEDNSDSRHTDMTEPAKWSIPDDAAFLHLTPNETIAGIAFDDFPDTDIPLVADMSSVILSQRLDVSRYGVIYAGAQKNIGPAGLAVVIIRRDLLRELPDLPKSMCLKAHDAAESMLNTPPTFGWYIAGQVFRWVIEQGGVDEMAARSARKSSALYSMIDESDLYAAPVAERWRSRMNVPFTLTDTTLEARFLTQAEDARLLNLAGHRSVGGMRASLYNAVTEDSVSALIEFMADFERRFA
jgi:phosphoserine aminotransferase